MERTELKPIIESLIFVSEEPMSIDLICMVLEETGATKAELLEVIGEIKNDYNVHPERGIQIIEVAGGYQFRTKPHCANWIQRLNVPKPIRLSQPAMETLSIIAYRQPIFRSDIESIRGVDSGGVIKTLLERGLVRIVGKSDEAGHPLVYSTTKEFLEMFGLKDLKDMPTLKEIDDLGVQDRVGNLGKEEFKDESSSDTLGDVIQEYKEEITAFTADPAKEYEDDRCIKDLENSIKGLRRLEKVMFPKPKEEFQAVLKDGETAMEPSLGSEGIDMETIQDESTPSQDTGPVD